MKHFLILLIFIPFLSFAQKNSKIAYVEEAKLLEKIDGYEQNIKEIDSLKKAYSAEIATKTQELDNKFKALISGYDIANNETDESLVAKLNDEDKAMYDLLKQNSESLKNTAKSYNNMLEIKQNKKVQPLLDNVNKIIEDYTKSNGIGIVYTFERMNVAFIDDKLNITEEIIKKNK